MGRGLPIYPEMTEEMIAYVVGQIRALFGQRVSTPSVLGSLSSVLRLLISVISPLSSDF
jgi:hypothetical protein